MNVLLILAVSAAVFYLGYRFYGRYIERIFDVDGSHTMPSVEMKDDVDYVPARKFVLFGHHFASIAGGGPILGPTFALIFGYLPVWLWIVLGTIFIGAVHDFTALLASVREKGRSMAEIAEKTLGRTGFMLFIGFTIIMLLMVASVFLTATAKALSSRYPLEYFGVASSMIRTVRETVVVDGAATVVTKAVIGGIASTSVIIITCCAPLLGYLLYRRNINTALASAIAVAVCVVSVVVGFYNPISIDPFAWQIILSVYTIFAAGVPVWLILQPRDFTNSFMLYFGIIVMMAGIVAVGLRGAVVVAPAVNIAEANTMREVGAVFPILFITVACGAISGFHALVAGGTSSKQLSKEKPDARYIGYGGMVLEGMLALGVLITVGYGLGFGEFVRIVHPEIAANSNPILAFALSLGGLLNDAFGIPRIFGAVFGILMVEGFVVTTLDTAVRLNRYLFEELWTVLFRSVPRILKTYIFNSTLCVALMFVMAYFNAFGSLWKLFGSANQLLAALTLITVSMWLLKRGKRYLFVFVPGILMFVTSISALIYLLITSYIPQRSITLTAGDIMLMLLSAGVVYLVVKFMRENRKAVS
ncbi:MAG: carbon starvation CstA family protein [Candidatus Krumholzibacteria bacterium]|nr:carbon starvation CstA family protein [Candidatus Krumholzibacteria bacterium]